MDGNLTLSYDQTQPGVPGPTAATLIAGSGTTADNLIVTLSFETFSSISNVVVTVWDEGKTSKLAIGGYAVFRGNLTIQDRTIAPPPSIQHVLIPVTGGVGGTFAGRPEWSSNPVNGTNFRFTYLGGDGNDVALMPPLKIGGRAWVDLNRDGVRGEGDLSADNYYGEVYYTFAGPFCQLVNVDTGQVVNDIWDQFDTYSFSDLALGRYQIRVIVYGKLISDAYPLLGRLSPAGVGGDATLDSDFTPCGFDADGNMIGQSQVFDLTQGGVVANLDVGVWWKDPTPGSYEWSDDTAPAVFVDELPT